METYLSFNTLIDGKPHTNLNVRNLSSDYIEKAKETRINKLRKEGVKGEITFIFAYSYKN